MECWFWNIDATNQPYFHKELGHGRLRQGWGYEPGLDLRTLSKKRKTKQLTEKEAAAWERCQSMLNEIAPGDLVAVKNIPDRHSFTIVQINGKYNYKIDPKLEDFGHYLPVKNAREFNKSAELVPAPMVNALDRAQSPIVITYKHKGLVAQLHKIKSDKRSTKPDEFKEKILKWRLELIPHLKRILKDGMSHRRAEQLIFNLLKRDGLEVTWTAGPAEKGADHVGTIDLGYALTSQMGVQVKMHWGVDNDTTGLDQLERAFKERNLDACLLVTFADKLGPALKRRVGSLRQKYKLEVLYGDDLYRRLLELLADSNHAAS